MQGPKVMLATYLDYGNKFLSCMDRIRPILNIFRWIALTGNAGTEKCSSVVPDESLLDIPSMSEAVVKPVTSMMLLLLGRMAYC